MRQDGPCIAVLGPTASGKSALAVEIAQRFDGEVVSCDSVQVYRRLDIGSAKPSLEERHNVPHHLIDILDPDIRVDAGLFKAAAEAAITGILGRGRVPVLCGGTGMYFNSLYYGLFDAPSRSDEVRERLETEAVQNGLPALHSRLASVDPQTAAKVQVNDRRRIVRALEVFEVTGMPISSLREKNKKLPLRWKLFAATLERSELYSRIDCRVDRMMAAGLVEETRGIARDFGDEAFALGSIGYRHCMALLRSECTQPEMIEKLKMDTRHYAKRQFTWFRKIEDILWADMAVGHDRVLSETESFLSHVPEVVL